MSLVAYQGQRRKIYWHPLGFSATVDFGTRRTPDKQEVKWFRSLFLESDQKEGYMEGEDWVLQWGDMTVNMFSTRIGLTQFLIRTAYYVQAGQLIPSEILFDAGLRYAGAVWIDSWSELDVGEKTIVEIKNPVELEAPENRKIRLEPYIHVPRGMQTQVLQARSYPHKITHAVLEDTKYEPTPRERIRFRDIGPEWEDPCPWYKRDFAQPRAKLIVKYHQKEDEEDNFQRRLRAALAVHSSD
jgi:hypothetical protein